ncbi:hypothetical protein AcW2_007158 [Taiwanofungus camphoratus]|nr:hypothetical protein AcW2_007158 [Antrodia cinnamomea]
MHQQHVAHRDISNLDVMMDPASMFPELYHPRRNYRKRDLSGRAKHHSRTERPTHYYFIDFGLSRRYDPANGFPSELPIVGGDKSVPEFQGEGYNQPCNPFLTNIYLYGKPDTGGVLRSVMWTCCYSF